jgi:predicted ribosome-associated RNA-binding protein Tma20
MGEQALALALRIAGHIGHPLTVALFAFAIAAGVFAFMFRAGKPVLAGITVAGIVVLGTAPFAASSFLRSRGVYHVEVVVVRPDQSSADIAQVKSSSSGELKMVEGGWELEIPPQTRPADGKVTFVASVKDEVLNGKSTLILDQDYYPTATVQLVADTSATVRGVVVDEDLGAIAGATVTIDGYSDAAVTDRKGNFVLAAHAGKGQVVEVHARKNQLTGSLSAPAGKVIEIVMSRQ